jgi:Domain of unknown function (DUF932)
MTTTETTGGTISDAERPLWVAQTPSAWGDVVRGVDPQEAHDAASMIAAAGLDWTVEQHPLEAVVEREYQSLRVPVPRHVANVRSDTGAVLGVVGEGYEPLQNASAFAFCDAITDSGRAHWIGAGATHGAARVHALMRLDREIRIGGAEGEDVLPLLCFRNGHDGGLAVTVSVVPFRLACLNGMRRRSARSRSRADSSRVPRRHLCREHRSDRALRRRARDRRVTAWVQPWHSPRLCPNAEGTHRPARNEARARTSRGRRSNGWYESTCLSRASLLLRRLSPAEAGESTCASRAAQRTRFEEINTPARLSRNRRPARSGRVVGAGVPRGTNLGEEIGPRGGGTSIEGSSGASSTGLLTKRSFRLNWSGSDGTRTRGLRRDRSAVALAQRRGDARSEPLPDTFSA